MLSFWTLCQYLIFGKTNALPTLILPCVVLGQRFAVCIFLSGYTSSIGRSYSSIANKNNNTQQRIISTSIMFTSYLTPRCPSSSSSDSEFRCFTPRCHSRCSSDSEVCSTPSCQSCSGSDREGSSSEGTPLPWRRYNAAKRLSKPLENGCEDNWGWSRRLRSKESVLSGDNNRTVYFHPNSSKGTAGVQGMRPLNNGRFYWELHVSHRVFGTSIMFGIGTRKARLHSNSFRNLLGENEHGWGLSHKGVLWHKGVALMYMNPFEENQPTVVGILFDGIEGTLTFYKDDACWGVAFRGLNKIKEPLYPIVCSTAAKTEMTLKNTRSDIGRLQERCRAEVVKHIKSRKDLNKLKLPSMITEYLSEAFNENAPLRQVDNYDMLYEF